MEHLKQFQNLYYFFENNPHTTFNDVMEIAEAMVCYRRLDGKPLSDLCKAMQCDYRQVAKIASELQISNYKAYALPILRQMVVDRYHSIFTDIPSVIVTSEEEEQKEEEQKEEEHKEEEQKEEEHKEEEQDVKETKRKRKTEDNSEGYVYVFSNPTHAHYGANVYKIGYSGDPNERVHDFDTGNPEPSIIMYTYRHKKARQLEHVVHDALDMFRLFPNREFFKCGLPVIKEMIEYLGTTM